MAVEDVPGERSLTGVRVAVTRSGGGAPHDRLTELLLECGARPIAVPLTSTEPAGDPDALVQAVGDLVSYDWLVVTSPRTVAPLCEALQHAATPLSRVQDRRLRICAVGPRTAEALAAVGLRPDLVPDRFRAEGVVESLLDCESLEGLRIFFPRAEEGRDVIPRQLRDAGAHVEVVATYRTAPIKGGGEHLSELVAAGDVDALTFTAGSAARVFAEAWDGYWAERAGVGEADTPALPDAVGVVALGPATASVLEGRGMTVHRVAHPHTFEGLVTALQDWFADRDGRG